MKNITIILCFCTSFVWSDISEYQLLWDDLAHTLTYGYKSHFVITELVGKLSPSKYPQASLIETKMSSHFSIIGPGFFKIVLDGDKSFGYTRNGEFNILFNFETEEWKLMTKQGYVLADPIFIYMAVIKRNKQGQEENIGTIEGNRRDEWLEYAHTVGKDEIILGELHGPKTADQLKIYDVPHENLRHYSDGIYVLDSNYTEEIREHPDSFVQSNMLEMSNVLVLEVLTRMYYLTVTDETIKNRLFKADLIKIGIEKYAQTYERTMRDDMQEYQNSQYRYIQGILPFIHYDY